MHAPKIFGIGFQKTATSSLDAALRILGYRTDKGVFINTPRKRGSLHIDPPLTNEKVLAAVLPIAEAREAFSDNPWPLLFRDTDARFPGSKFILTIREPEAWIASIVRHFGDRPNDMMQWIYGIPCPAGHEARCLEVYEAHNSAVRSHFASRSDNLLELDLTKTPRWDELCRFLEKPVPNRSFPHANTATARERKQSGVWRILKKAVRGA